MRCIIGKAQDGMFGFGWMVSIVSKEVNINVMGGLLMSETMTG